MWIMNREDHLNVSGGVENVVSKTNDGIFCFVICGVLGNQLMVGLQAAHYALGVHLVSCCVSVGPLLQSWFAWR